MTKTARTGDPAEMTSGGWRERVAGIRWSVFQVRRPGAEAFVGSLSEELDRRVLDLKAPRRAPDGDYLTRVTHGKDREGTAPRVRILNGKFVPEPTGRAILLAPCRCMGADERLALRGEHVEDHVFVEGHTWEEGSSTIEFRVGS